MRTPRHGLNLTFAATLALVLGMTLVACSGPSANDNIDTVLEPAKFGSEWQAKNFSEIYAQEIEWHECDEADGYDEVTREDLAAAGVDTDGIACAMIAAPFDWTDPKNHETIELSIVHIPATGDAPQGTLLSNPGGPGATGVDFALGQALAPGFEPVLEQYDLLGFDPRGIGGSTPLVCEESASELRAVRLAECIASNPIAHTMGTVQVARDMDLMRHLMGEEQLDFLGYSYGTMLGATYASIFPKQAGRLVLDSAENAEWASPIHSYDQAVAIANATVALATGCRTEYQVEVCPFTSEQTLLDVLSKLDKDPLVASGGNEITGEDLKSYLAGALYESQFGRARTLEGITLALFGDQDAIDAIADSFGGDEDFAFEIVSCHSFPVDPNIPGLLDHIQQVGVPKLMGGPAVTDEMLAQFVDLSCYTLPESGLDYTERFEAPTPEPILVIGITGDHATPFQYAEALVDELGNARLLTLDGQGHAASYSGRSTCIDDAVTAYLLDGDLPAEGTVCLDDETIAE